MGCFILSKKNHVPVSEGPIREGGFDSSVNEPRHCVEHLLHAGHALTGLFINSHDPEVGSLFLFLKSGK